jgi:Tfp pilus assembly protein PilN
MQERRQLNFAQRWKQGLTKPNKLALRKARLILAGFSVVLAIGLLGSAPWIYHYKLSWDLGAVNQQIQDLKAIDDQVQQQETLKTQIAAQEKMLDIMKNQVRNPSEVLELLRRELPIGAVVNNIALNADNTVNVALSLPGPIDVARLWASLAQSQAFEPVDLQKISLLDQEQSLSLQLKLKR